MIEPVIAATAVFAVVAVALLGVEKLIHRLTKNPDRSYRFGVWLFAWLSAVYTFVVTLGRHGQL